MANASTEQHKNTRCVTNDTLQALNLKTDNNLDEYIVIIVGIHDRQYLFQNLPTLIGNGRVRSFDDIKTTQANISTLENIDIFLIISGTLGKDHVAELIVEQKILGVYIYCMDENTHTQWAKEVEKIRCIVSNATQLLKQLHGDIKQLSGRWPLNEKSFQKALIHTSQWYHLFLIVICNQSLNIENSYKEMFDDCRAYYRNNSRMIERINQLEQNYTACNAIREYTCDGFLYRIVNHALRTRNMEIIIKYSPFIRDLHCQLYQHHEKYYRSKEQSIRSVYRGQSLSLDELNYLQSICQSKRPIITFTTFSSTSLDPEVAMNFTFSDPDRVPCLFEIIITDAYNIEHQHMIDHEQIFADISALSVMPEEKEVLFSLKTHFRVKHVEYPPNHSYRSWATVTLELISDKMGKCSYNYFDIVKAVQRETNPQIYHDILHLLKENAKDELNDKSTNWDKWWSTLSRKWGTDEARTAPLLLTMYSSFTDNPGWSRKAIEMHKDILHTHSDIHLHRSSFSLLFKKYKHWQKTPTKWLALYEDYLEEFCKTNTKEVIQCMSFAAQTYLMIADKENAIKCYGQVLNMNFDDKIQRQINNLNKAKLNISTTDHENITMVQTSSGTTIKARLEKLLRHLEQCQQWYDAVDAKILFCIQENSTDGLSVNDYRLHFISAVRRHLLLSYRITDATNNEHLTLWRYEKYMREWILFKALANYLKRHETKSISSQKNCLSIKSTVEKT
ncbi:hypothetical protein I4U23_004040 [Adineta vaga]|nr:hypothetical protein I4U23_004040 [Adineta vaga]